MLRCGYAARGLKKGRGKIAGIKHISAIDSSPIQSTGRKTRKHQNRRRQSHAKDIGYRNLRYCPSRIILPESAVNTDSQRIDVPGCTALGHGCRKAEEEVNHKAANPRTRIKWFIRITEFFAVPAGEPFYPDRDCPLPVAVPDHGILLCAGIVPLHPPPAHGACCKVSEFSTIKRADRGLDDIDNHWRDAGRSHGGINSGGYFPGRCAVHLCCALVRQSPFLSAPYKNPPKIIRIRQRGEWN